MKGEEELEKIFGYTREELDRMAVPWERGEWPPGVTVRRGKGRPRITADDLRGLGVERHGVEDGRD